MSIEFRVIEDIKKAEEVWEEMSPHVVIDHEWKFRYTFFKHLSYKLHFIAGYDGNTLVGLLPLQYNNLHGLMPPYYQGDNIPFLEFFGGDDTDDNEIFIKNEYKEYENIFLDQIKQKAYLGPLIKNYKYKNNESEVYEHKYMLPVEGVSSWEDYIEKYWEGSNRKKLRQQIRKLYRENNIKVLNNNYQDIDILINFNKERFKENSSFDYEYRQQIFKDLINLYQVEMLTILVNDQKMGVSYGIKYKDSFIGLNAGVDRTISDLGKLLILQQIQRAIELTCKVYDAGKGSGGWKTEFKFNQIPQYKLVIE